MAKRSATIKYPTKEISHERENSLATLAIIQRSVIEESRIYPSTPRKKADEKYLKSGIDAPVKGSKTEARRNIEKPKDIPVSYAVKPIVDTYDLPSSYNATSLTLIARDPFWLYAYWEIAPSSVEPIRRQIGDEMDRSKQVLRMYDISFVDFNGHNANKYFDLEAGPHLNNYYINLWCDNASYCAEIGVRTPDGRFFAYARSNRATTPRAHSSDRRDEIWMEKRDDSADKTFVVAAAKERKAELDHQAAKKSQHNARQASLATKKTRKIILNDSDIRAYYSKLSPYLKDIISERLSRHGSKVLSGRSAGGQYLYIKGKRMTLNDMILKGMSRGEFIKKLLLGSSAELVSSEVNQAGGASEQSMGDKRRKFFFEIGAELIVYGRTEPDAWVWLGDKNIKLRDDGTFTLRYALPDGKIPFDFVAESNDKVERREISTAVERSKTRYNP